MMFEHSEKRKVKIDFIMDLLTDILVQGGIAFGGVVRDLLSRHNPIIVNNKDQSQKINYDKIIDVPEDIDVVVSKEMFNRIVDNFSYQYSLKKIKNYESQVFSYTSSRNDLELIGYELIKELTNECYVKVKIDFLIIPYINSNFMDTYPPFSNKTLECDVNCLIFEKDRGLSVSPKLINNVIKYNDFRNSISHIGNILDNIRSKKMVVFRDMDEDRLKHMLSKGWTIENIVTEKFIYDVDEIFDDVCIICNENFSKNDLKIHINDSKCKCNIRYCIECLKEMSRKNIDKCPICKILYHHNRNDTDNVRNEIKLLSLYK